MRKQLLAGLLREIRIKSSMTQLELSVRLGQSQSYISKYEKGEQRLDFFEIEDICKAVGVDFITFIGNYLATKSNFSSADPRILGICKDD
jgi:transcriptional regulator with XRE-family HTH domain